MNFIKVIIFQIFTLSVISCSNTNQEYRVELNSNWEFKSPIDIGIEMYDKLWYKLPDNANDRKETNFIR